MSAISFVLNTGSTHIMLKSSFPPLPAGCMAVITAEKLPTQLKGNVLVAEFSLIELQQLHSDIESLLINGQSRILKHTPLKILPLDSAALSIFSCLFTLSKENFLTFAYTYCLSQDRDYFSSIFFFLTSGSFDFCKFIESHFNRHYCVNELAEECGLSLRKFNQIFMDIYGESAKSWLLNRRIEHAKYLLGTTSMRILDVALECGFSHHAHFTYSFRRCEKFSPSEYRKKFQTQFTAPELSWKSKPLTASCHS